MVTLDLAVTYVRPAVPDETHRIEGEVLYRGRARIVSEARILRPDGKLAVSARGSFLPNPAFQVG
jgi:acyl-coenzyme A thioesterase PaaI-like protein